MIRLPNPDREPPASFTFILLLLPMQQDEPTWTFLQLSLDGVVLA